MKSKAKRLFKKIGYEQTLFYTMEGKERVLSSIIYTKKWGKNTEDSIQFFIPNKNIVFRHIYDVKKEHCGYFVATFDIMMAVGIQQLELGWLNY